MTKYLLSLILFLGYMTGSTQTNMAAFATMEQMQLEYLAPIEEMPKFLEAGKIKYFEYDFGLELDNGKTIVLVQTKEDHGSYIPQVEITALVATLASNNQDVSIAMLPTDDKYLTDTNSDWAIESLFTPKKNIGKYKIAHLKSMFKTNIGVVNILYLAVQDLSTDPILKFKN